MLCGITPWHIRALCDDPWEGGRGHRLADVVEMTLDQVLMLLADRKMLRRNKDGVRTAKTMPGAVRRDKDGMVKGRAGDGTPIRGRIAGKSKARQLMEAAEERRLKEKKEKRTRKRKR